MDTSDMRIGEVAAKADVSVQTLRYYERRGLLPVPLRKTSGYRRYSADALQRVRFIRRAQDLGFTLEEIGDLLRLWADSKKSCEAVEEQAAITLSRIDEKIRQLETMRDGLAYYVTACHRRDIVDGCPLLTALGVTVNSARDTYPRVELVFDPDCPNIDRARSAIRNALRTAGAPEEWKEWDRGLPDTPAGLRDFGSPTVLVNGRDIGCDEGGTATSEGNSCRIYADECGCICGAPSADLILSALTIEAKNGSHK